MSEHPWFPGVAKRLELLYAAGLHYPDRVHPELLAYEMLGVVACHVSDETWQKCLDFVMSNRRDSDTQG